jgi:predicted SAM-dependent methyltransferase
VDRWRLERLIRSGTREPLQVSLGCGSVVEPGWIGIDLRRIDGAFRSDLRAPLPFPDGSVSALLAEHIVEHLAWDDIPPLLAECHRVLRPGGVLRIVSPDALLIAALLREECDQRSAAQLRFDAGLHGWHDEPLLALRVANRIAYQWHQHGSLLTTAGVAELLYHAGFTGVESVPVLRSHYFDSVPGTHAVTSHGLAAGTDERKG